MQTPRDHRDNPAGDFVALLTLLRLLQMLTLYCGCEVLGYVKSVQDVGTDDVDLDTFTREQVGDEKASRYDVHTLNSNTSLSKARTAKGRNGSVVVATRTDIWNGLTRRE